jgi:hypothetical protein
MLLTNEQNHVCSVLGTVLAGHRNCIPNADGFCATRKGHKNRDKKVFVNLPTTML